MDEKRQLHLSFSIHYLYQAMLFNESHCLEVISHFQYRLDECYTYYALESLNYSYNLRKLGHFDERQYRTQQPVQHYQD